VNNIALCVMVLCSISTVVFNANPLMRFDGYYILADWLEIPNLREKANRFLNNLFLSKALGVEVPPEPYMAPWRKWLFVVYAITSWVYRWVVLFGILWFLADFLGPKLKILSQMLALVSLASIFVWPTFKIVRNIRQRGRLPDMKAARVYITLAVLGGLVAAFFMAPLPVSRVHETGLVEIQTGELEVVSLPEPATLTALKVRSGQRVEKGNPLGEFHSRPLDVEMARARATRDAERLNARRLAGEIVKARSAGSEKEVLTLTGQERDALARADTAERQLVDLAARVEKVRELKAPRSGLVVAAPIPDEVGKLFDRGVSETSPLFSVGDPTRLVIRVPVTPPDYRLIKQDLAARGELAVTIHVKGRSDRDFTGRLRRLPEQNAATVPIQLTQRGGGPLAVKPGGDPNVLQPLAQVYLVEVEILDPDAAIDHGQLAVVKIHTKWRSAGWWVGRALSNALDIGFY
jgi:putative peptide zinc metalloprotease protein